MAHVGSGWRRRSPKMAATPLGPPHAHAAHHTHESLSLLDSALGWSWGLVTSCTFSLGESPHKTSDWLRPPGWEEARPARGDPLNTGNHRTWLKVSTSLQPLVQALSLRVAMSHSARACPNSHPRIQANRMVTVEDTKSWGSALHSDR